MNIENIKRYYKTRHDKKYSDSLEHMLFQAGKTQLGIPVDPKVLDVITHTILNYLNIRKDDEIIDLGCANGLITKMISQHTKSVIGFDISDSHISYAKKFNSKENIEYNLNDILDIDFSKIEYKKIYMYEVLQHFDYGALRELLNKISMNNNAFALFVGSIPDAKKIFDFYHTKEYKTFYFEEVLEKKIFHIGNWWYQEHILNICQDLGLECEILEQNANLHTHYYRFDALIRKESK